MRNVLALVLGGGRGSRLYPLTKYRSKPAVPLAGKYRLIDIPLSNCINSGIKRIYVLTQFMSVSLHRHISQAYRFDRFEGGFVSVLAAQQTLEGASDWYQGTADAVRKNLRYIQEADVEYVLILSGDQLYRMNFAEMLRTHQESDANVTIATIPVHSESAAQLGVMRADDSGRVNGFLEKPKTQDEIDMVRMDPGWIDAHGIESRGRDCLASMGIYLFDRQTLCNVLTKTDYRDFGREIFPASIRTSHVQTHLFDGYWEDIGNIKSFYHANLDMASKEPPFALATSGSPIFTRARFLPPSRLDGATVHNSLLADGCIIENGTVIENSVIGLRCRIGRDVTIRDSVLMGIDHNETPESLAESKRSGIPLLGIGHGSIIDHAIIDKDCRIGCRVQISNDSGTDNRDISDECVIRDGIIVVEKNAILPDGWKNEG